MVTCLPSCTCSSVVTCLPSCTCSSVVTCLPSCKCSSVVTCLPSCRCSSMVTCLSTSLWSQCSYGEMEKESKSQLACSMQLGTTEEKPYPKPRWKLRPNNPGLSSDLHMRLQTSLCTLRRAHTRHSYSQSE